MNLKPKKLAFLISTLFLSELSVVHAAQSTDLGRITVEGQAGASDTGLIQPEESPKARSSVGKAAIEKQTPTSTAFQLIQALPGVSTFDQDGTGLFGGTLRVRGFNSNQMGLTLDGAPLNDSLNYSIFIQEFADPENTCEVFLTQGSTDLEAPHVGASGGNIGIATCAPRDKAGGKVSVAFGSNDYRKAFVRLDTGKFMNDRAKLFISLSKAQADKFKGDGGADRRHIDFKGEFDFGGGSYSRLSYLYNRMINANYRTLSKNDIATGGYLLDFGNQAPVHQPPGPGAQNDATFAPNAGIFGANGRQYAPLHNNPFENYQVSLVNHWQLSPKASLEFNPYYIYGYGFGGNQLTTLAESAPAGTRLHGGVADINGDADTADTVAIYGSNTSKTRRWGLTTKLSYQLDIHNLSAGLWRDSGTSSQFGPAVRIDDAGNSSDFWLKDTSQYLRYNDGTPFSTRNWLTDVDAQTVFLQDSFNLMKDKLNLVFGLKRQTVERTFNNFASGTAANAGGADYVREQSYGNTLANIGTRYQLTENSSSFFNAGQNARAPENNASTNLVRLAGPNYTTTIVNGVLVARDGAGNPIPIQTLPARVKPEKSNNFDLGYRFAGETLTFSGSAFYVDFRDRLANQFDPASNATTQFNVGKSRSVGIELEAGYKLASAWSMYGSLTVMKSKMLEDKVAVRATSGTTTVATLLPTAGKELPDTPKLLGALNLQYATGGLYGFVQGRYVGSRYTSLVNDDKVGGYSLFDLGAGYRFPAVALAKSPTLRLNVTNLFDKRYLSMSGPSGSSFTNNVFPVVTPGGTVAGSLVNGVPNTPQFYVGAPRALQVTLSSDF